MKKIVGLIALLATLLTAAPLERATAQVAAAYFAIDNSGVLTITPAGAAAINALTVNTTYTLTVMATNAGGNGGGVVTIVVTVPVVAPPVVQPSSLNLTAPVTAGQTVGTVMATGNPTSWAITGSVP